MLKLKYMFENFELAKCALENWNYDEDTLDEYLKYFRISSNAVYPFEVQGKRCFLRLAPAEEKQKENLEGELEFLQYLNKKEYNAMKPVVSKSGSVLVSLDTRWGVYYASVFEGVPGCCIEDTDYREEVMHAYGKALGRLHRLSMEYGPKNKKWSYTEVLDWITCVLTEYHAPDNMVHEAEKVAQELSHLEKNQETYGLVHYDFEPDNEKRLPLMRRFCNLFSYARLIRCIAEEVPNAPEWMERLKERLAYKVRSLEEKVK